jgi:hypothetical protein
MVVIVVCGVVVVTITVVTVVTVVVKSHELVSNIYCYAVMEKTGRQ